jgi:adenine-specific DNA-methyltransferase
MSVFACTTCGRTFDRADTLKTHRNKKNACKPPVLAPPQKPDDFRPASVKFNKELSKETRQATGIFFTPKKARDLLFDKLAELGIPAPATILEPSFGTGEILLDAAVRYPKAQFQGVELNEDMFKSTLSYIRRNSVLGKWSLRNRDFLDWSGNADLIIGNPPYFVTSGSSDSSQGIATGRPNIYITFLHKCLDKHLKPDGHLAFIIPTSLYNCSYYQGMRDYIATNTTIRHVETLNRPGFYETGQETMLIILQKRVSTTGEFLFKAPNGHTYISPAYKELYELTAGATTVGALGLGAKTGNVVWNQVKENLTDDTAKGTLLIYASNIKGSELCLNNLLGKEKKQYVKGLTKPTQDGPVILVERGYGNAFSFNTVFVDRKGFYAENHLNVIYPRSDAAKPALARIIASFKDPRTKRFVALFNGNGTISASDLENLIPVF